MLVTLSQGPRGVDVTRSFKDFDGPLHAFLPTFLPTFLKRLLSRLSDALFSPQFCESHDEPLDRATCQYRCCHVAVQELGHGAEKVQEALQAPARFLPDGANYRKHHP